MTEQEIVHAVLGAGAGGGIVVTLTKFLFQKLVNNLEYVTTKTHDILVNLSAISVKLEVLDQLHTSIAKINDMVQTHETKIATLHTKVEALDGKKPNRSTVK